MSRNLSNTALADLFREEAQKVWLVLLKISHSDMTEDINVVNNTENITSTAIGSVSATYQAFPFTITLPEESETQMLGQARINIGNFDSRIMAGIRSLSSPADVTLAIIHSDSPNDSVIGPITLSLQNVDFSQIVISGEIGMPNLISAQFPRETFNPYTTPGVFRS